MPVPLSQKCSYNLQGKKKSPHMMEKPAEAVQPMQQSGETTGRLKPKKPVEAAKMQQLWDEFWARQGDFIMWRVWVDKYRDYIDPCMLVHSCPVPQIQQELAEQAAAIKAQAPKFELSPRVKEIMSRVIGPKFTDFDENTDVIIEEETKESDGMKSVKTFDPLARTQNPEQPVEEYSLWSHKQLATDYQASQGLSKTHRSYFQPFIKGEAYDPNDKMVDGQIVQPAQSVVSQERPVTILQRPTKV